MNEYEDFERRQQRTRLLVGDGKLERLRRAHVLVLGVGGVGAYAAEQPGPRRSGAPDAGGRRCGRTLQLQPPASGR